MIIRFGSRLGRCLRRGSALLSAVAILVVGNAVPFADSMAASTDGPHFEIPGGPASEHAEHNHAFCAVLGATPVLPSAPPRAIVGACGETIAPVLQSAVPHTGHARTTQRSRAPPAGFTRA